MEAKTKLDLTGQTFEYLYVIERMPKEFKRNTTVYWHCRCRCGKDVYPSTYELVHGRTKSCGCRRIEMQHQRVKVNPGDRFNKLVVVERVENTSKHDQHSKWDCVCDCGNHVLVFGKDLTSGKRDMCTACKTKLVMDKRAIDITGMRFGKLVAMRCIGSKNHSRIWECQCDCGQVAQVPAAMLTFGNTKSCGCMRAHSFNENKIGDLLNKYHVEFLREFSFDDLVSDAGNKLRFDFAIYKQNEFVGLIEYQGEQHYIVANHGFGEYQREVSDKLKRDYCKQNNIPLYEIKYNDNIESKLVEILS